MIVRLDWLNNIVESSDKKFGVSLNKTLSSSLVNEKTIKEFYFSFKDPFC